MRVKGTKFPTKIWTADNIEKLRRLFPTMPATDIADEIGCSDCTVLVKARELGLRKDPSWHRNNYIGRYTGRGRYKQ